MSNYAPILVKNILKDLRNNRDENFELEIDLNFNCNHKFTYTPNSIIKRILYSYRLNESILLKQTSNDDFIFSDVKTLVGLRSDNLLRILNKAKMTTNFITKVLEN